jgi:hypothetical protein
MVAPQPLSPDELVERLHELRKRVAPRLPDMDPGDLLLILEALIQSPAANRRFFVREIRPGVYVP